MKVSKNKTKIFTFGYLILIGVMIISSLFYMSQYTHVHVYYDTNTDGTITFYDKSENNGWNNEYLFRYFYEVTDSTFPYDKAEKVYEYSSVKSTKSDGTVSYLEYSSGQTYFSKSGDTYVQVSVADAAAYDTLKDNLYIRDDGTLLMTNDAYCETILNFQMTMSNYNTMFLILGVVSLCLVAVLFILSNHSRRIYYKSNLIGGVIVPLTIIVFTIILMIQNFSNMALFNNNYDLFCLTSLLQKHDSSSQTFAGYTSNYQGLVNSFNLNDASFIIYTILFVIIIAYSVFMIINTISKYNKTAEERKQIIEKAVENND